jgi:hypothetical protein
MYFKRSKKCGVDYRDVIPNTNISAYITCLTTPIEFGISDNIYTLVFRWHIQIAPPKLEQYLPRMFTLSLEVCGYRGFSPGNKIELRYFTRIKAS